MPVTIRLLSDYSQMYLLIVLTFKVVIAFIIAPRSSETFPVCLTLLYILKISFMANMYINISCLFELIIIKI